MLSPSRSGKGRLMSVFMSWSGLRWPPRCRAPDCAKDRKVLPTQFRGKRPATRADGPSACPGDSSHERGRVGASDANRDMQQAAKSIRVRNAGGFLRLRRSRRYFGPLDRVTREGTHRRAPVRGVRSHELRSTASGAAVAANRLVFRTPLSGDMRKAKGRPGALIRSEGGDDACS